MKKKRSRISEKEKQNDKMEKWNKKEFLKNKKGNREERAGQ